MVFGCIDTVWLVQPGSLFFLSILEWYFHIASILALTLALGSFPQQEKHSIESLVGCEVNCILAVFCLFNSSNWQYSIFLKLKDYALDVTLLLNLSVLLFFSL